jgi:hypothetical protein
VTVKDELDALQSNPVEQEFEREAEQETSPLKELTKPRTLISFAIAIGLIALLLWRTDINLADIWANILQANPFWFLAAFIVYYLTFPLRGWRWSVLLGNVGITRQTNPKLPGVAGLSEIIYLGWFANTLVPAKLGDAYRAYLLKKNARVSFSTTLGTVLAERVIDMLVLFGLLFLASLTFLGRANQNEDATNLERLIVLLGAGMSLAIVAGLLVFWKAGDPIERRLPGRFRNYFAALHVGVMMSFRRLPQVGGVTIVIWLMEATRLYLVGQSLGFGAQLDFPVVLFVALAGSILTTIPLTPGGLAVVEGGTIGLLVVLTTLTPDQAASLAVLDRVISYWSLLVGGFLVFLVTKKK